MRILQPPGWVKPRGFSNGIVTAGRIVFVGGQVGWNANGEFETADFVAQARRALENIVAVLAEAGGLPEHIARMTWYVVDKAEYLASLRALGGAYRDVRSVTDEPRDRAGKQLFRCVRTHPGTARIQPACAPLSRSSADAHRRRGRR